MQEGVDEDPARYSRSRSRTTVYLCRLLSLGSGARVECRCHDVFESRCRMSCGVASRDCTGRSSWKAEDEAKKEKDNRHSNVTLAGMCDAVCVIVVVPADAVWLARPFGPGTATAIAWELHCPVRGPVPAGTACAELVPCATAPQAPILPRR